MTIDFHNSKRSLYCPPGVLIWKHSSTISFIIIIIIIIIIIVIIIIIIIK